MFSNKTDKYRQGVFNPKNRTKYIGRQLPVYRSGWELRFFRWCDENTNVIEWASEAIIIPYVNPIDGKTHRYYTDGVIAIKETTGISKYIIEIKPSDQVLPPEPGKKRNSTIIYENKRYIQNMAKWKAAKEWCKRHNYKFLILTEKELGLNK
jgi:hypothetical protein